MEQRLRRLAEPPTSVQFNETYRMARNNKHDCRSPLLTTPTWNFDSNRGESRALDFPNSKLE